MAKCKRKMVKSEYKDWNVKDLNVKAQRKRETCTLILVLIELCALQVLYKVFITYKNNDMA